MSFEKLTLQQRVQAANIDCMRHPQFALISSIICMGKSDVDDKFPTAATNGKDKIYGAEFIKDFTRKQMRYVVLHENFHVAFKHCTLYDELHKKHPATFAQAIDYAVNGLIEEMDPQMGFVERPTNHPPLVDKRFEGMSMPQIMRVLLDEKSEEEREAEGYTFDEHQPGEEQSPEEQARLMRDIDDAVRQGELLVRKMAGDKPGGRDVFGTAAQRYTDWKPFVQDWLSSVCQGDENSRFSPPNKRMLASGFLMPSHFSETIGEIIIACDTSGSMHGYYPTVFGEVARIMQNVRPEKVRMLWWDTEVAGDQEFTPDQYDQIATQLSPRGGGGTHLSCVAQYITDNHIDARAVIILTDGHIETTYTLPELPVLFGVVENDDFVPLRGKAVRIHV